MCIEDIRIGSRRWYRTTKVGLGNTVTFPGNSSRVLLRLIVMSAASTGTGTGEALVTGQGQTGEFSRVTAAHPVDEITLEKHGSLVYTAFDLIATAANVVVVEVFQDDQQNPPGQPSFPTRGVRGPIPTSIP